MAVVSVMRCPANHAANDSAAEVTFIREWATATSWDSTRESLLAEGHCSIGVKPFAFVQIKPISNG
jgi:hypothetical protein